MEQVKKHITLLNFHSHGHSEKWILDNIPNKGDLIDLKGNVGIVDGITYQFSEDGKSCNIFITTTKKL
jgi:hypothetical protein